MYSIINAWDIQCYNFCINGTSPYIYEIDMAFLDIFFSFSLMKLDFHFKKIQKVNEAFTI